MREIARTFYWLLPLKMVSRDAIIKWADELIADGAESEMIFELSTCRNHDENVVMDNLNKLATGYDGDVVRNHLLESLRDYLADRGDQVSTKLLFDYMCIDDLNDKDRDMFSIAGDEIVCNRDGTYEAMHDSERGHMIDLISYQLRIQQDGSSEPLTRPAGL